MLRPETLGLLVLLVWATALTLWLGVLPAWERWGMTEASRREREAERATARRRSLATRGWAVGARAVVALFPTVFVVDGLVLPLGIPYAPSLSFLSPLDLPLQLAGFGLCLGALTILGGVGRTLAVHVYRKAADERSLLTTGIYAHIRHPFYLHFFLLPAGFVLLTLNLLAFAFAVAYLTLDGPKLPTAWMREEEDELLRRHGPVYAAYVARTGRLLPRLRKGR